MDCWLVSVLTGKIPLDPNLLRACEDGSSFIELFPSSPAVPSFVSVVDGKLVSSALKSPVGQSVSWHLIVFIRSCTMYAGVVSATGATAPQQS